MSDEQNEIEVENEEFEMLKMEAKEIGVKFRSDIGQEKLQERVDAKLAEFEKGEDTPVGSNELPTVEIEKDETKPAQENNVEQDVSDGETWVDGVAMIMLRKGHGQKNILNRACVAAKVSRQDGVEKFRKAKGSLRERLIAIFG